VGADTWAEGVFRKLRRICAKALSDRDFVLLRNHSMRHSCASILITAGADPVIVATHLGHKDASTTLRTYAKFYPERMEQVVDTLAMEFERTRTTAAGPLRSDSAVPCRCE